MTDKYEYVKAIVAGADLRWEYKLQDSHHVGRMTHDKDVSDFTEREIVNLTRSMFELAPNEKVTVEYA